MDQGQDKDSPASKHQVRTPLHAKALIEELDFKQLVVLRDGRRSWGYLDLVISSVSSVRKEKFSFFLLPCALFCLRYSTSSH